METGYRTNPFISEEQQKNHRNFAESAIQIIQNEPNFESYYRDFVFVNGVRYRIYIQRDLNVVEIPTGEKGTT